MQILKKLKLNLSKQSGFTLVEIIVATAIFVTTVSGILILFNYVLRINQEVQVTRKATQSVRNFTEILVREIRTGRVQYKPYGVDCSGDYTSAKNNQLALITAEGDELCFSLIQGGKMQLEKTTSNGSIKQIINSDNLVIGDYLRFIVAPSSDPQADLGGGVFPGAQPVVTILAEFTVTIGKSTITIPYQTSVSTDIYDIPNQ